MVNCTKNEQAGRDLRSTHQPDLQKCIMTRDRKSTIPAVVDRLKESQLGAFCP